MVGGVMWKAPADLLVLGRWRAALAWSRPGPGWEKPVQVRCQRQGHKGPSVFGGCRCCGNLPVRLPLFGFTTSLLLFLKCQGTPSPGTVETSRDDLILLEKLPRELPNPPDNFRASREQTHHRQQRFVGLEATVPPESPLLTQHWRDSPVSSN